MAITSNGYGEGMNKDITRSKYKPTQYIDAQNIRIATKDGLSTLSVNNVKGNQKVLTDISQFGNTLPVTQPSYYLKLVDTYTGPYPVTVPIQITVNGITTTHFFPVNSNTVIEDLYQFVTTFTGYGTVFNAAVTDRVVIYSISQDVLLTSGLQNVIECSFNSYGGVLEQIIGYGTIRDSIILFTTSDNSATGGQGSIWKLTYDDTVQPFTYTLKLLYSNLAIGFTTQHPIINEAKGNYENIDVQKIYWTDNLNNVRYINTEDPNLFAITPDDLSITPSVSLSVPKLYSVNDKDGSLIEGTMYQCFYRLVNVGGGASNYSDGSGIVSILYKPEENLNSTLHIPTTDYYQVANGLNTGKSITFQISNIDTSYDIVEVVAVNVLSTSATLFYTTNIGADEITCTFRSENDGTPVDIADITTYNAVIDRAKTIEVKDQRLLVGNVKESAFNVDFDTRAYRFPTRDIVGSYDPYGAGSILYSGGKWDGTFVKSATGNYTRVDSTNYTLFKEADAINPDQRPYERGDSVTPNYKYQADGITIGGEGPNISYKFTLDETIYGDNTVNIPAATYGASWRRLNSNPAPTTFTYNNRTYNVPANTTTSFIDNYHYELYKSYQHEEIYRFGIVFIDKTGRRSTVSWIADILMPGWYEESDFVSPLYDFSYSKVAPTLLGDQTFKCLGVEFTLKNTNLLPSTVTAYEIVRVKRTESDKSVLFGGPLTYSIPNTDILAICFGPSGATKPYYQSFDYYTGSPLLFKPTSQFVSIIGLDNYLIHQKTGNFYQFKVGDYITIPGSFTITNNSPQLKPSGLNNIDIKLYKAYVPNSAHARYDLVKPTLSADSLDPLVSGCGLTVYSTIPPISYSLDQKEFQDTAMPPQSVYGPINYSKAFYTPSDNYSSIPPTSPGMILYAYYHRVNPDQYGGNSYFQRASNTYIPTYNYNKITDTTTKVFGGDMYYYIHDYANYFYSGSAPSVDDGFGGFYYPVETYYQLEWQSNQFILNRFGVASTNLTTYNHYFGSYRTNDLTPVIQFYSTPFNITSLSTIHDNRIYASELKYNGESGESWGIFKANNFRDVDSIYGPINKLITWKDNVYFFQDKAYGVIPVNVRSLVQDTSGSALQLGTGDVLTKQGYVSFDTGTRHQFSVVAADSGIYFYDILGKNLMVHKGQPVELSETQGLDAYFPENLTGRISVSDNTLYGPAASGFIPAGIVGVFDYRYNQVIYTFKDAQKINGVWTAKNFTVAYNDLLGAFESFYSFDPYIYISDRNNVFSVKDSNLHLHNYGNYGEFYGVTYPSSIKFITNPNPNLTKIFDNIAIQSEVYDANGVNIGETVDKIRCTTDYQDSGTINLVSPATIRRRERTWTLDVPRDTATAAYTNVSKPRLRDKYLVTELTFTNNNNKKLVLHDTVTAFRESKAGYPDL